MKTDLLALMKIIVLQATSLEKLSYVVVSGLGIILLPALAVQGDLASYSIIYSPFYTIFVLIRPNY